MKCLLVTALIISIVPSISSSQKENMVRNGGFEEDADGNGMAEHWQFTGDEGVTATWGRGDRFETDGRTVIIAWIKEGAAPKVISLSGKPWRAMDIQGNELKVDSVSLSERPIYFVAKGMRLKDFPW